MLKKLGAWFQAGTIAFNEAELTLLRSVAEALPEPDKTVFSAQIAAVSRVQRQHPGRLVVAFYKTREAVAPLPYAQDEYCLARVSYRSAGEVKRTDIFLHHGRFTSLERNVPQGTRDVDEVMKVDIHPGPVTSVADEIDREEHGPPS